jgi:hypothetical protein
VGGVLALNGFFGGGAKIPEDTFTRGLVGYWSFDEGSGQYAYDGSGNSNTGTLGGTSAAEASDPKWSSGKVAGALQFDGSNDYVDCGNDASLKNISNGATFEFWVNAYDLLPLGQYGQKIISRYDEYNIGVLTISGTGYYVADISESNVQIGDWLWRSSGTARMRSPILFGWHHIIVTVDTTNGGRMYVDGVLKSTDTWAGSPYLSSYKTALGNNIVHLNQHFRGLIDEVRIYNRALSAAEVRYHYNRGGPVAHWTFDEGNGITTYDMTDNNNDGTLGDGTCSPGTSTCPTWTTPTWTTGKYGAALKFDGVDDYVDLESLTDHINLSQKTQFTISAWIKTNNPTDDSSGSIFSMGLNDASNNHYLRLYTTSAGKVQFRHWRRAAGASSAYLLAPTSKSILSTSTWYYITAVQDGIKAYIYINGILEASAIEPSFPSAEVYHRSS